MNGVRLFGINQTAGIDDNYDIININDDGNNEDRHVAARRNRRQRNQQRRGKKED